MTFWPPRLYAPSVSPAHDNIIILCLAAARKFLSMFDELQHRKRYTSSDVTVRVCNQKKNVGPTAYQKTSSPTTITSWKRRQVWCSYDVSITCKTTILVIISVDTHEELQTFSCKTLQPHCIWYRKSSTIFWDANKPRSDHTCHKGRLYYTVFQMMNTDFLHQRLYSEPQSRAKATYCCNYIITQTFDKISFI